MTKMDDQTFAQKAMEANLAEITMAKLALQKGSSEKVKEYAQMMIDEHSQANEQLKSMVSGVAMGNAPERTGTMGSDAHSGMDHSGATSGTTGTTMGSGTTGSAGAGNTGTMGQGNTGSKGSGSTGTTGTNGTVGRGTTGTSGTGTTGTGTSGTAGTSGTTGTTMGSGTTGSAGAGNTGTEKTGSTSGTTDGSRMGQSGTMDSQSSGMGSVDFDDPSMLSAEHRAAKEKLEKLSGAAFDREYIMGQIKDHEKTATLFENQIKSGKDARLKEYARTLLPSIRKHRQMASDMANTMRSGSSQNSGSNN